jgi:CRP-like cAMP-binding protein
MLGGILRASLYSISRGGALLTEKTGGLPVPETNFETPIARKLGAFLALTAEEHRQLASLQAKPVKVKRGKQLVREGEAGQNVYVLLSGWACSYKDLPDGRRQIISFPVAGDCVGLRSALLKTADHSLAALTDAVVSSVDGPRMLQTFNEFPRLGTAILWAASRDEAMVVEHLVSIGRRSAIGRTAHFFMELAERLTLIGQATAREFRCPLSQYVLADALGLSAIHVNRVLRQLRERELLTLRGSKVTIHDLNGLRKVSGFRGGYLNSRD